MPKYNNNSQVKGSSVDNNDYINVNYLQGLVISSLICII